MEQDFAIIETGGKQYKVFSGGTVRVEKLRAAGSAVVFDRVLLRRTAGRLEIGAPYIANAKVSAEIIGNSRSGKKIVFKYHPKTRFRKKRGHRQEYSEVRIAG